MSRWAVDKIKELLNSSDVFVERSLLVLYKRQTREERASMSTGTHNNMGFNKVDAQFLTSLASQVERSKWKEGNKLSPKQRYYARKKLQKYAKQLTTYANTQEEIKVQKALGTFNQADHKLFQRGGTYE